MSDTTAPTREDILRGIAGQVCPWCGAERNSETGRPFRVLAAHTARVHDIGGHDLRRLAGYTTLDRVCTPAHAEMRRAEMGTRRAATLNAKPRADMTLCPNCRCEPRVVRLSGGLNQYCATCAPILAAALWAASVEGHSAQTKAARVANPEKYRARSRGAYAAHRDENNARQQARRARRKAAGP